MRGEPNAGRFPVLIKRADSIDVSHLYVRSWAAFFPYQEIGDECKSSASTRMLGGDRDRVKLGTCFEFQHSSFKQTSPLPSHSFLPLCHPFYCASTRSDMEPERETQQGTGPAKK